MITQLLKTFFTFLFPPSCIICSQQTNTYNLCNTCTDKLPLTREFRKPWLFSLYAYRNDPVATCIHYLKHYPDNLFVRALLTQKHIMVTGWILGVLRIHACTNIILVPVPIHRTRFLDRGYNQSEIIAQEIKNMINQKIPHLTVSIRTEIIQKQKLTQKQALITDRTERLQNIKNAFTTTGREATLPVQTLIIIIDDVTTTGGTVQEIYNLFPNHPVVAFTLAH